MFESLQLFELLYIHHFPYNKLDILQQLEIQDAIYLNLLNQLNAKKLEFGEELDYDEIYDLIIASDVRIKALILNDFEYTPFVIYKDEIGRIQKQELKEYSSYNIGSVEELITNFYNEIKAKCILAGVTPLLERNDSFVFSVNNNPVEVKDGDNSTSIIRDVEKVITNSVITFGNKHQTVTLTSGESIYITAPNYIQKSSMYGGFTKYFYKLKNNIRKNGLYELGDGESIVFCWKADSEDSTPCSYRTYV